MKDCIVYIVSHATDGRVSAPVKVGITENVSARMGQLRTGSAAELVLIHAFTMPNREIARAIEEAFHSTQSDKRLRGEWFDMHPVAALQLMVMNIEAALSATGPGLSEKERAEVLEKCGVDGARTKLEILGLKA